MVLLVFLGGLVYAFWYVAQQETETRVVQVAIPEKKDKSKSQWSDSLGVKVAIGATSVLAEVAESDEKKKLGLGKREKLDAGTGMLFVFDNPGPCPNSCSFWNKDMLFPIDVVWIHNDTVADLYEHLPTYAKQKDFIIMPKGEVNFVLEVSDGFIKKNTIKKGDKVTYEPEKN